MRTRTPRRAPERRSKSAADGLMPLPTCGHEVTATLHALGCGRNAGAYYTDDPNREARPRTRDNYYSQGGSGTWWSRGSTIVRTGAPVDTETFRDLCAGFDPRTGKAWCGVLVSSIELGGILRFRRQRPSESFGRPARLNSAPCWSAFNRRPSIRLSSLW